MISVYLRVNGYPGDRLWNKFEELRKDLPSAKVGSETYMSWLAQKGFGPGYYNNSGRYVYFVKLNFKGTEVPTAEVEAIQQLLKSNSSIAIFTTCEEFAENKRTYRQHEKHQNKMHPY